MSYRPLLSYRPVVQKVNIDGVDMPYRPVDIDFFAKPVDMMSNSADDISVDLSVDNRYRPVDAQYRPVLPYRPVCKKVNIDRSF